MGGVGDDRIYGGAGEDTVVFSGNQDDYNIVKNNNGSYTVQDKIDNRDDDDTVTDVEQFQFADGTVAADDLTLSANLIDGAVEGVEYTTTSGLHGFTDEDGEFTYKSGDEVTFNIGGVTLGVATAEDVASGKTFLQDIADVDRTNLNDEYLENMATFLQSLDENNDAYDGIVITDEIREALADSDIDLRTASEEDVQELVEEVGKSYISEDAAMDHVEDMLVEHTDLDHEQFQEHIDDDPDGLEESLSTEQHKINQVGVMSTTAATAATADSAIEQINVDEISDLSINIPSLDLPGEEQKVVQPEEAEATPLSTQETHFNQTEDNIQTAADDSAQPGADPLAQSDLSHSLPSESLSSIFDDSSETEIEPSTFEHGAHNDSPSTSQEVETPAANEEVTVEATSSEAVSTSEENTTSSYEATESSVLDEDLNSDSQAVNSETNLSTDDLHINVDDGLAEEDQETQLAEGGDDSLDRFSATNSVEENDNTSLNEFSANDGSDSSTFMEDVGAVEDIGSTEPVDSDVDQVTDAGLSDGDVVQEEVFTEQDQVVDVNPAG